MCLLKNSHGAYKRFSLTAYTFLVILYLRKPTFSTGTDVLTHAFNRAATRHLLIRLHPPRNFDFLARIALM